MPWIRVPFRDEDLGRLWTALSRLPAAHVDENALITGMAKVRAVGPQAAAQLGFFDAASGLLALDERLFADWPSPFALAHHVARLVGEALFAARGPLCGFTDAAAFGEAYARARLDPHGLAEEAPTVFAALDALFA